MSENTSQVLEKFFLKYPARKYSKGQILLLHDEIPQDVFFVESGRIRQYVVSDNGNEIILNIYRKNTYFPVYLALTNSPSDHIFAAMSEIEVRKAPVFEFIDFFVNTPEIIIRHLQEAYVRSNKGLKRMTYAVASSAYYRILFEIINECGFLSAKKDGSFQIPLHVYEIAECAGLSRETASREFQKLKEQKLVRVTRKFIIVKNLDKLKLELGSHI